MSAAGIGGLIDRFRYPLAVLLILGIWQAIHVLSGIPPEYFPPVTTAVTAFFVMFVTRDVIENEIITLSRVALGMAGSVTCGISLAILAAAYQPVRRALEPITELMRPIPAAAILPISIFIWGFNYKLFLFLTVFVGIWPVYLNTLSGLNGASDVLINAGRSFGCGLWALMRDIRLPHAVPEMFVGIRIASASALTSTTVAEMLTGRDGIGSLIFLRAFAIQVADVFALTLLTGINSILLMQMTFWIRDAIAGWHKRMALETS